MTTRPNIVLFLTDDHGAWANGCYGNTEVHSPTLDALATNGTQFNHAYTPCPVCSPARACLLTGKTPSQVGIHDWLEEQVASIGQRNWLGDVSTLFRLLSDAGYHTGLSGKWHLGQSDHIPDGVDYYFGADRYRGIHKPEPFTYVRNGETIELDGNKSALITRHALEFLDTVDAESPYFLYVGYRATHSPYEQQAHEPQLTARYQDCEFKHIPPYKPHPWVHNEGTSNQPTNQELRDRYIGYYAAVNELDDNIHQVLTALKARDDFENTIIMYTSDHGCALGHHGFFGKGNSTRPLNMYETSLQVPLIWSGAGIHTGVISHTVDHYDTFRTVCDIAGVTLDDESAYPGTSYLPLLQGKSMTWDDTCYGEYGDLRMIRNTRWKLVYRYPDGPHDLFDLQADPDETQNVYAKHPDIVANLKQRLDTFYAQYSVEDKSGLRVKDLPQHNVASEAWRDGAREMLGFQIY